MQLPIYIKNILYIVGICIISFPFLLINYLQINATDYNNDININFNIFDYLYSISPIIIAFILIIPVIVLDKIQKTKMLYSIGLNYDRFALRDIGIGILAAAISVFVASIIINSQNNYINVDINKQLQFFTIINIFCIVLSEELFFRGYIFQNIYRKNNSITAVFISSLMFAFAHFIGNGFDIVYFLNTFIAGILFCIMYIKTKSLWISISFHFSWNLILYLFNNYLIEFDYICSIILLILIFVSVKILKPSYKINKYHLTN